jgi:hypothetical protein
MNCCVRGERERPCFNSTPVSRNPEYEQIQAGHPHGAYRMCRYDVATMGADEIYRLADLIWQIIALGVTLRIKMQSKI